MEKLYNCPNKVNLPRLVINKAKSDSEDFSKQIVTFSGKIQTVFKCLYQYIELLEYLCPAVSLGNSGIVFLFEIWILSQFLVPWQSNPQYSVCLDILSLSFIADHQIKDLLWDNTSDKYSIFLFLFYSGDNRWTTY